jgi:hypothetical protein
MLVIEIEPDAVNLEHLTQSQRDGEQGLLATAMGAYIEWLLADFTARVEKFRERVDELRSTFTARHRRTPAAAAELTAALDMFLAFAVEAQAISQRAREENMDEATQALDTVARSQAAAAAGSDPATRFRDLVRTLIATQRAHLLGTDGSIPQDADTLGWRCNSPGSEKGQWIADGPAIGWADGGDLYLDPDGSYAAAQELASKQHEPLGITAQTLRKRLAEAGLLASREENRERLTVRRTIQGRSISVLHVANGFLGEAVDDNGEPEASDD